MPNIHDDYFFYFFLKPMCVFVCAALRFSEMWPSRWKRGRQSLWYVIICYYLTYCLSSVVKKRYLYWGVCLWDFFLLNLHIGSIGTTFYWRNSQWWRKHSDIWFRQNNVLYFMSSSCVQWKILIWNLTHIYSFNRNKKHDICFWNVIE